MQAPAELPADSGRGEDDELVRRAAARRLLGRGRGSAALDGLAQLAARLLGCATGQISLTTDVQTVVGAAGLPSGLAPRRVEAAGESLCEITARAGAPLVVSGRGDPGDAPGGEHGPRTRELLGGLGALAYLGVPLVDADERAIGTLCVADPSPRSWGPGDVEALRLLGASVLAELERSALAAEYESDRVRWETAARAAGIGTFDAALSGGLLRWDDRMLELMGVARDDVTGTWSDLTERLHPDDLDRVRGSVYDAVERRGSYQVDCRVVRPDGTVRWMQARGRVLLDAAGAPEHLVGTAHDTTDQHEGEARVARALETMETAFLAVDPDGRVRYANAEAGRLVGRARDDLLGAQLTDVFPAAGAPPFVGAFRDATASGRPVVFEAPVPDPGGAAALGGAGERPAARWCEVRAWPAPDGLSISLLDVTVRRTERRRAARAAERTTLLARVTAELAETLDPPTAMARLARLLVPVLADWCLVALTDAEGRLVDVGAWHGQERERALLARHAADRSGLGALLVADEAVRRGLRAAAVLRLDADDLRAAVGTGPARAVLERLAPSSALALPLRARGRSLGVVVALRGADRPAADVDDVALAQEIALRAGLSIDNARLYEAQRDLAEELQRSLLGAVPALPGGLQVAVRYLPASVTAHVGGDWYDAFVQPGGRPVVVIGDVVGHDTTAAASMGQVRALLRGIAHTTGAGPAELLTRLDAALDGLGAATTATSAVLTVEREDDGPGAPGRGTTRVRWSNAGHPPPLVVTPDGEVVVLDGADADLLLGIDPTAPRREAVRTVPPGSTVLLHTDGLVERRDRPISAGLERLRAVLAQVHALPLEELCDAVLAGLVPGGREDDVAVLALRLDG